MVGGRYFVPDNREVTGRRAGAENGGKSPIQLFDNDAEELFLAGTDEEL